MTDLCKKIFSLLLGGVVPRVNLYLAVISHFRNSGRMKLAKFFSDRLQRKYGLFISPKAVIDGKIDFKHPTGIVIGDGVRIGKRVVIFQNVTLGGARMGDWKSNNYPEIGDDTVIFAGAVVVGKVRIGRGCVVGANSVVTKDVADFMTVAGVPAKVIKIRSSE